MEVFGGDRFPRTGDKMKTETTLRSIPRHEPAKRSPEREKLAAAIAAAAEAERSLDAARRSVTRAGDAVRRAEDRLAEARTAVSNARSRHVDLLSEAARQGAPAAGPSGVREARRAEADALEEIELAQTAEAELRSRLPALDEQLRLARNRVVVAVDGLIRSAADGALEIARRHRDGFREACSLLEFFLSPEVTPQQSLSTPRDAPLGDDYAAQRERDGAFKGIREEIEKFRREPLFPSEWNRAPNVEAWQRVRAELFTNPGAAFPTA
jgi:chromosome segregation ATPase